MALATERARRDEAINERREIQAERDDLAAKLDKALGMDDERYVANLNRVLGWCDAANVATGAAG